MRITFIRHGHSDSNEKNILSSNITDEFYLTDLGVEELINASQNFSPKPHENIYIYSSPMKRTIHSAEVYIKYSGLKNKIILDERISEIHYGEYSGQENINEIQEKIDEAYTRMAQGDMLSRIGQNGENKYEFLLRNYDFLLEVIKKYIKDKNSHIIIFSHAGPIRAMENILLNSSERRPRINNGEQHTHTISKIILQHIEKEIAKLKLTITEKTNINKDFDVAIIGAGLFGIVCAEQLAKTGKKVVIFEKNNFIGGACASYLDKSTGIEVHRYGPHIFHIKDKKIFNYILQFEKLNNYRHKIKSAIATTGSGTEKFFDMPLNLTAINKYFDTHFSSAEAKNFIVKKEASKVAVPTNAEEAGIKIFGKELFDVFFASYTKKQWGRPASLLPPTLFSRYKIKWDTNNEAFSGQYQGIPLSGYDNLFHKIINHSNNKHAGSIEVRLNSNFIDIREELIKNDKKNNPLIIYTGAIDEYFDYKLGELEYRSLKFVNKTINKKHFQPVAVVNYPDQEVKYTRICEHKYFHPERVEAFNKNKSIITFEYPVEYNKKYNERFYPIEDKKNLKLYNKYKNLSHKEYRRHRVLFGGRLGEYKYYDMEGTIKSALKLSDRIIRKYL